MTSYSRNNLTSKAYDVILQKIISAEYKPGQKISEKKIEEDVNIGRTRFVRPSCNCVRKS